MVEPIATYSERRFARRRDFRLIEDRLQISIRVLGMPSVSIDTPLQGVQTLVQSGTVPDTYLRSWLLAIAVSVFILGLAAPEFVVGVAIPEFTEYEYSSFGRVYIGALILVVILLVLAAFLYPAPLHFVGFLYSSGNLAFDVIRVGTQRNQFDAFVESVRKRVSELQAPGGTSSSTTSGGAAQTVLT
jgi:hypothetical protein